MIVSKRRSLIFYLLLFPFLSLRSFPQFFTPELSESVDTYKNHSIEAGYSYAQADKGFDAKSVETSYLNIYGKHAMHKIALNEFTGLMIPKESDVLDPLNRYGGTLTVFTNLVPAQHSGDLLFNGKFTLQSAFFYGRFYIIKNLFLELESGMKLLKVDNISYTDLTPEEAIAGFTKDDPAWANFLTLFDEILGLFKLSKQPIKTHGASDTKITFGYNYKEQIFGPLDCSFIPKIGFLIPTGKEKDPNHIFSVPLGYDKHPGIIASLSTQLSLTYCTLGILGELLFLQSRIKNMRMKTSMEQSGLFLVARGDAKVTPGRIAHVYSFFQLHTANKNYYATFGYRYTEQEDTTLYALNEKVFNAPIINSHESLKKWKSHSLHADIHCNYFNFAIDYPLQGTYSFKTKVGSTKLSISIVKEF